MCLRSVSHVRIRALKKEGPNEPRREHGTGATPGDARTESEKRLMCAACLHTITSDDYRIEKAGMHAHTRVNPEGVTFVFGCFADAPGARADGDATTYYSWFHGFAWRIASCRACNAHLGWRFEGSDTGASFWALILERLSGGG